jgi:hypothetical protein
MVESSGGYRLRWAGHAVSWPACAAEFWTPIEPPDFEAMCNLYFYGDAIKPLGSV